VYAQPQEAIGTRFADITGIYSPRSWVRPLARRASGFSEFKSMAEGELDGAERERSRAAVICRLGQDRTLIREAWRRAGFNGATPTPGDSQPP
jgi:hypothetical protein